MFLCEHIARDDEEFMVGVLESSCKICDEYLVDEMIKPTS